MELDYWLIKNPTDDSVSVGYSNEELEETYASLKRKVTYTDDTRDSLNRTRNDFYFDSVELPYDDLDEGYYTLSLKITDTSDNYVIYQYPVSTYLSREKVDTKVIPDSNNGDNYNLRLIFNPIIKNLNKIYHIVVETYLNGKKEIWLNKKNTSASLYYYPYYDVAKEYTEDPEKTGYLYMDIPFTRELANEDYYREYEGCFVCIKARFSTKSFADVTYVYPDYERFKDTDKEIVCNITNILPGYNHHYQIYTDNPIFVHTMYWKENLGNDVALWETKGIETGIENNNLKTERNWTYSVTTDMVPSGYYYTVIAHFANGEVIMTDVKQR